MPKIGSALDPIRKADILVMTDEAPWIPGAADGLANCQWSLLERQMGISEIGYATARVLARDVGVPRAVMGEVDFPAPFQRKLPILVECLPSIEAYERLGLRFTELTPASAPAVVERLREAVGLLSRVGGLAKSVGAVLAAVHVLDAPSPDHDVSFSDPHVPFSAFVGIHRTAGASAGLRLAEQLVHESMHLQLTLLEAIYPLVSGDAEEHWSPWQATMRPTRGVLHGFYVFKVLDAFFSDLACLGGLGNEEMVHLNRRRLEIKAETSDAAASLSSSVELTAFGRAFLTALSSPRSPTASWPT